MRPFPGRLPRLLGLVLPWPLLRFERAWASHAASAGALLGLLASRLLLLPAGPWEQDEALIACGVVDFDPGRHMPLPPGFPLWVAIGKLVRACGVADPVAALQFASAVLSVIGLWALVGLWDGVAGRRVALAGAALAAFLPGVWFHAGRAFSETPSAALAILGFAFWLRGGRDGFAAGVAAMTCAALVRPPLAPLFALAVALASWRMRGDLRRMLRGLAAGPLVLAVVLVPAALAAGGWSYLWSTSVAHVREHVSTLGTERWGVVDWGYVRGLAGPWAAAALATAAAAGWLAWRRRLGRAWFAGSLAGAWLVFLVVFMDNRTYPRYWVLVWLLLATPAVAGVAALARSARAACVIAAAGALSAGWWTFPAMRLVHRTELPVVSLLRAVAGEGRGVLVFDDTLFSFRNVAALAGWLRVDSLRLSEMRRTHHGFGAAPFWILAEGGGEDIDCPISRVLTARCLDPRVVALSQDRFLDLRLVRNPVLAWQGGFPPEWEGLRRFVWCRGQTSLLLPAVDGPGTLALAVEPNPLVGAVELRGRVNGVQTASARLAPGRQVVTVPIPAPADATAATHVEIVSSREGRSPGDTRPLALRIFAAWLQAPPHASPPLAFFPEPESMFAAFAQAEGTYAPELLGEPARPAAWTGARAAFSFPVGAGTVGIELFAPRPDRARVELRLGSARSEALVGPAVAELSLPVPPELARGGRARLELTSSTYVPGGSDTRALGVAVGRIWYLPSQAEAEPLR